MVYNTAIWRVSRLGISIVGSSTHANQKANLVQFYAGKEWSEGGCENQGWRDGIRDVAGEALAIHMSGGRSRLHESIVPAHGD